MAICFSPNGDQMRRRATQFPGLVNSTVIDWFHPWPRDALVDVSRKFLAEIELGSEETREAVV
jgi:dynein heavy chain